MKEYGLIVNRQVCFSFVYNIVYIEYTVYIVHLKESINLTLCSWLFDTVDEISAFTSVI